MSLCLNPECGKQNPEDVPFCETCGSLLLVLNRYRALRKIGEGGFSRTYLGIDEAKPSFPTCVLKQFHYNDPTTEKEALRLFLQESIRLDALGKHPQIPDLLAQTEHEGTHFVVQEYIEGENLGSELAREGPFSAAKIQGVLNDLLPILQFIHTEQVIHRDIKPENIIRRSKDGRCVLIDFGAAKLSTALAQLRPTTKIGSLGYSAPEQLQGKACFASDLYSLGKTCLHLLTGVMPGEEGEFEFVLDCPPLLRQILNTLTATDPNDRFPSAAQAWQALNFPVVPRSAQSSVVTTSKDLQESLAAMPLEMVAIPGGKFLMGSSDREEHRWEREGPLHRVDVAPFYLSKYPITQSQYREIIGKSPSRFRGDNLPIERVSWLEAIEFCQLLGERTAKAYRLPSEAEWEYACRAGTTTPYYFGRTITAELVNFKHWGRTTRVGSFPPNGFGIYDMHGNVWEWCYDQWHNTYQGAPNNSKPWLDQEDSTMRVLRGGSWTSEAEHCRSAYRKSSFIDSQVYGVGFRIALSID